MANPATFANSYVQLPALFYRSGPLSPVASPVWALRNDVLASQLGLDAQWFTTDSALQSFAGNTSLPGATPIALAYSGHQFGGWSPLLGDGRALLAGEWQASDGNRYDLHLKGSGPTVYARRGDGRATLGAMLREYIVSEAFAGLGIPTTRALCVVNTGETVYRQTPEPGAVLTRVAKSHVRVGTFQLAAANRDVDALRALLTHELARNFPPVPNGENAARHFLREVIARQARLIAQWMSVGFIHGVMNTDNMQVAGETIDFGPCAFMDTFHPQKVFSSIDQTGRYAWDKQPGMAQWNLTRLAECLLTLLHDTGETAVAVAQEELAHFMPGFERHFENAMRAKLGWHGVESSDGDTIATVLSHLMRGNADFTIFFRRLTEVAVGGDAATMSDVFSSPDEATDTLAVWRQRAGSTPDVAAMRSANPVRIARNHRVEEAIQAANKGDLAVAKRLVSALRDPFTENPAFTDLEAPPSDEQVVRHTFCGT